MVLFVITSLRLRVSSVKFILLYALTFYLVYLTKTRLLLVFVLIYPILRELIFSGGWLTRKRLFLIFYGVTLFIYPLYVALLEWFPNLLTSRYGGKTDTSFGLRNYLYLKSQEELLNGSTIEILFGRGNEYARNFVYNLMKVDYMPHNDYLRVLIDWGVLGFMLFSIFLYKMATKNNYTLFIALTYMVLFYSNMIFNLFLVSILISFYYSKSQKLNTYAKTA
ncbi:O-antigen ligase family protein [Flagellimonas sp. 2504JD1-5]